MSLIKKSLVKGEAVYLDDLKVSDVRYLSFVRSTYPHARIHSINLDKLFKCQGVEAVITAEDMKEYCQPMSRLVEGAPINHKIGLKYPLALGKVRFVGEPVVAIVTTSPLIAADAIELVEIEYEPLKPVNDPQNALDERAPLLYEELGTNEAFSWSVLNGDPDTSFRNADIVVSDELKIQRVAGVAMETRGAMACYDRVNGRLTLWSTTHRPHALKTSLALLLNIPEEKIRVVTPQVGGSFGTKTNTYPEEVVTAFTSILLHKPVKWVSTRREDFLSATHGRDMRVKVVAGARNNGELIALKASVLSDLGAYWHRFAHGAPLIIGKLLSGCYRVKNYEATVVGVYTNKMATHVYRGTGRPEAAYVIEKIMDRIARKAGLDPAYVRTRNFIPPDLMPYKNPAGSIYDSGDYQAALNKALQLFEYEKMKKARSEMRKNDKLVGIGIASYVEVCSVAGGWEYVEARVEPTGRIRLFTGISSHGQSTEEVLRLIFAKEMELNANDIDIVTGDTDVVAYGWGSIASRSLMAAGSGVVAVAQKLKERLLNIAATLMEANINDLAYSSGKIHVKDSPQNFMTIRDIASQIYAYHGITSKAQLVKEPLTVSEFVHIEPAFPYGTHVCMVEIDKDTGEVKILKYVAVDDVGRIISRELVEGQIIGGIVSGVGQTLLEEIIYAENCTLITDSLINYAIPSSNETPNIISDFIEVPAPNKLGVKGAGESGVVGAIAALANAIEDALSPFNVEISSLPLTPWIIWQTLKSSAFTKP